MIFFFYCITICIPVLSIKLSFYLSTDLSRINPNQTTRPG